MAVESATLIFLVLCALIAILPAFDVLMRSHDQSNVGIRRLLRRRAPGYTPDAATCSLVLFGLTLVAAASPFPAAPLAVVAGGAAAWAVLLAHRFSRAERLFRQGIVAHGRVIGARLERDGLELDYAFEANGAHTGSLTVTDALVAVSIADDVTVFVFHDPKRPAVHVALLARELEQTGYPDPLQR